MPWFIYILFQYLLNDDMVEIIQVLAQDELVDSSLCL